MGSDKENLTKQREICFLQSKSGDQQAQKASRLLDGIEGIKLVRVTTPCCICVHYNISHITLRIIEEALVEVGFALDHDLLTRILRLVHYYTEETQLVNLGYDHHSKSTKEIFINRYAQMEHGCRDDRPEYYHHYK